MKPTVEELCKLALFDKFSKEQLEWLVAHSEMLVFDKNEQILSQGEPGHSMFVLAEGEWRLVRDIQGRQTQIVKTDYAGSWIAGIPLFSGVFASNAFATKPSRILRMPIERLQEMLSQGFPLAEHLIAGVSVGVRNLEANNRQTEKMAALGKLSAGLAHELNNPAAAALSASSQFRQALETIQDAALRLPRVLSPDALDDLRHCQREIMERSKNPLNLSTLEQSEREDELNEWLEAHEVEDCWELSPVLVENGLDIPWLEEVHKDVGDTALNDVLRWFCANLSALDLANRIEQSMERITTMVKAIKEYSFMDQAAFQEINVHDGLKSTVMMLSHEFKSGITLHKELDYNLPKISAFAGELNQVWTNLIDNAIDAMNGQGDLWIRTRREDDFIVVEIEDNGPGIPPEIQSRIYEPFFTTKGVGEGTGLGLDIVYRVIVNKHQGDIKLESQPGKTKFSVYLPINLGD